MLKIIWSTHLNIDNHSYQSDDMQYLWKFEIDEICSE